MKYSVLSDPAVIAAVVSCLTALIMSVSGFLTRRWLCRPKVKLCYNVRVTHKCGTEVRVFLCVTNVCDRPVSVTNIVYATGHEVEFDPVDIPSGCTRAFEVPRRSAITVVINGYKVFKHNPVDGKRQEER